MRYAVVIEKAEGNYAAYVGLRADGIAVPPPSGRIAYVEIEA